MNEAQARKNFQEAVNLQSTSRHEEAREIYETLLQLFPERESVLINLSACLIETNKFDRLEELLPRLEQIKNPMALLNAGSTHFNQYRTAQAAKCFHDAYLLEPSNTQVLRSYAICLFKLKKPQAAASYCLELASLTESPVDYGRAQYYFASACDWTNESSAAQKANRSFPFFGISRNATELENLEEAKRFLGEITQPDLQRKTSLPLEPTPAKIRIGYLCGEFKEHATLKLLIGALESHNASEFEIYYFDNGIADHSSYRIRLEETAGAIISIHGLDDLAAIQTIRSLKIHILINLNGYFGEARNTIFFRRAAPIQVSFLGYPATLAHPNIDYIIADPTVLPEENEQMFSEKVYRLPGCYQPNDDKRPLPKKASRREYNLPSDDIFVFCCLNNTYKITEAMFSTWAKILKAAPKAKLLLLADNADAQQNLTQKASELKIQNQIFFQKRLPTVDYINALSLCDLFLDTSPYNAHTTGSDSLWAGTPILTLPQETFPSRVGLSLIRRARLDESLYIADNYDDYVAKALFLYQHRTENATNKAQLRKAAQSHGGFVHMRDYTKQLETAYKTIYETTLSKQHDEV